MRKSFSLLELILVVTILSIIIGSNFRLINSQIITFGKIKNTISDEFLLYNLTTSIAKKLRSRVSGTLKIKHNRILWVEREIEAEYGYFDNNINIGFSNIVDLNSKYTSKSSVKLLNSNLEYTNQIIKDLKNKNIKIKNNVFAYFNSSYYSVICKDYDCSLNILEFTNKSPKYISEYIQLVTTASSIELTVDSKLKYFTNYRPWLNEDKTKASTHYIASKITSFKVINSNKSLILKICINSICKSEYI